MKMADLNFVDGWQQFPRWISVRTHAINAAFLTTWATLPAKFQDALPIPWVIGIAVTLLVIGVVGGLIDQPALKPADKDVA